MSARIFGNVHYDLLSTFRLYHFSGFEQYFVAYALAWSAPLVGSNGITLTLAGENIVR